MIEVEKQFFVNDEQKQRLTDGAEFLGKKILRNEYFDDDQYSLTSHDFWLRRRNGNFELKIPIEHGSHDPALVNQYRELETESEIRAFLDIPFSGKSMEQDLQERGFFPFLDSTDTREKYTKQGFTLDFDDADFSDFRYQILEIERLVSSPQEAKTATEEILNFAQSHDLMIQRIRGKVFEFLKRKRPNHYQFLVEKLGMRFD